MTTPVTEPVIEPGNETTETVTTETEQPEKDWQSEAEKWKSLSRKNEDRARSNAQEISELRETVNKQTEMFKQLAAKAGVELEQPKPEDQLAKFESSNRQLAIENAVIRKAQSLGADVDALMDSRAFMSRLQGLNPNAADFTDSVESVIQAALEDGRYKANKPAPKPPVPKAGSDFSGAPVNTGQQWTVEQAMAASPDALSEAIDKGLLVNLGFGKPKPSYTEARKSRNRIMPR